MAARVSCFSAALSAVLVSGLVHAGEASPAMPGDASPARPRAVAKAGAGQAALAVGFDASGVLRARVCAAGQAPCSVDGATEIPASLPLAPGIGSARMTVAPLGRDRRAVVVEVPRLEGGRSWAAIVAAPLRGSEPLVVWSGETGFTSGLEGERTGKEILVRRDGVYVGTTREGRDLCGRPALLSPHAVDPSPLELRPVKLQRLSEAEREAASPVVARPATGDARPPALLRAVWATSAKGGHAPAQLTDESAATAWLEDRAGVGRGEFVVMSAPKDVPFGGFEVTLPPAPAASPSAIWLATDGALFEVTFPALPARERPERWLVELPGPLQTSCVALVLESTDAVGARDTGMAELALLPALQGTVDELVRRLSAAGPEADAAVGLLGAGGPPAHAAVRDAFATLDEGGRRAALRVLDQAGCDVAVPAYVLALAGSFEAHRAHARAALGRCPQSAVASEVERAFEAARDGAERAVLIDALVEAAPAPAVQVLVRHLATRAPAERRLYRAALARAVGHTDAAALIPGALASAGEAVALEVLRALSGNVAVLGEGAEAAFVRLAAPSANFRTRYLLLGVAADLAAHIPAAEAFLRRSAASDPSQEVRAEALRQLPQPGRFSVELLSGLSSPAVRVREAAATTLGRGGAPEAAKGLIEALEKDPWPRVRAASASALSALPRSAATEDALLSALDDESKEVRYAALLALGRHLRNGASPAAKEAVKDRLDDLEEEASVRAAAVTALGRFCARESASDLTRHAARIARVPVSDDELLIGSSAVDALSELGLSDLRERLAPLLGASAAPAVRRLAQAALTRKAGCAPRKQGP